MTRENKLALIIGFSLLLVVAVLLADHLSPAQQDRLATLDTRFDAGPAINLPAPGSEGVRQFASGEETQAPESHSPPIRLIDPPTPAVQTQQNVDDAINEAALFEREDDQSRTHFGPATPENQTPDPLIMGHPVNESGTTSSKPANRGDAEAYTVRENDTLYGLCKRFYGDGGLYEKLAKFNEGIVSDNGWIREGMTIWIPSRNVLDGRGDLSPTTPSRKPTSPPAERPAKSVKTVNYTIKENDRLWDIAKAHLGKGGRWQEIVDLNKDVIKNPDVLPVGKTIRLPAK